MDRIKLFLSAIALFAVHDFGSKAERTLYEIKYDVINGLIPYYKFLASVLYEKRFRCVASVVDLKYVLTVADCVIESFGSQSAGKFSVRVGTTTHTDVGGSVYDVERVHFHPGFNLRTRLNRVVVIELREKIQEGEVKAVKLVNRDYNYVNATSTDPHEITRNASQKFEGFPLKFAFCDDCGEDRISAWTAHRNPAAGAILMNMMYQQFGIGADKLVAYNVTSYLSVAFHRSWIDRVTKGSNETIRYETAATTTTTTTTAAPDSPSERNPILIEILQMVSIFVILAVSLVVQIWGPWPELREFYSKHVYIYSLIELFVTIALILIVVRPLLKLLFT